MTKKLWSSRYYRLQESVPPPQAMKDDINPTAFFNSEFLHTSEESFFAADFRAAWSSGYVAKKFKPDFTPKCFKQWNLRIEHRWAHHSTFKFVY